MLGGAACPVCCPVSILKSSSETIWKPPCSPPHAVCGVDPCLGLGSPRRIPLPVVYCEWQTTSVRGWGSEPAQGTPTAARGIRLGPTGPERSLIPPGRVEGPAPSSRRRVDPARAQGAGVSVCRLLVVAGERARGWGRANSSVCLSCLAAGRTALEARQNSRVRTCGCVTGRATQGEGGGRRYPRRLFQPV